MRKYNLCIYASRYWFVHIREGHLEEKLVLTILKSFETQGVRDSVTQTAGSSIFALSAFPGRAPI